jgi:hypothetical protein
MDLSGTYAPHTLMFFTMESYDSAVTLIYEVCWN